jgi:hypothetical protein
MTLEFSRQIYETYSNIKCHENPYSGSRAVPCGGTDGRTDMTKLIVGFCNFANASNNAISPVGIYVFDIVLAIESRKL